MNEQQANQCQIRSASKQARPSGHDLEASLNSAGGHSHYKTAVAKSKKSDPVPGPRDKNWSSSGLANRVSLVDKLTRHDNILNVLCEDKYVYPANRETGGPT